MASQAEDSQLQQDGEESQLQETQDSQAGGATLPILKDGKRLERAYENVLRNPELGKLLDKWVAGQEEARRKATSKPASKPSNSSADPTPRRSSKRGIDSNAKEKESTPSSSSSSFPQRLKERVTIDLTKSM